ncbi:MAG: hypothetical protein AAGM29_16720, partial [Cyanobacteria bacterium J06588_4]
QSKRLRSRRYQSLLAFYLISLATPIVIFIDLSFVTSEKLKLLKNNPNLRIYRAEIALIKNYCSVILKQQKNKN